MSQEQVTEKEYDFEVMISSDLENLAGILKDFERPEKVITIKDGKMSFDVKGVLIFDLNQGGGPGYKIKLNVV